MTLPTLFLVGGRLRVDGRAPDRELRTHVSDLAFVDDLVVKRKRAVDLGFLDHRDPAARERACHREVELNRRICPDVHLGVADVRDELGRVVDHAVVMRRLPDEARLATRLRRGDDVGDCVRGVARTLSVFHAGAPPVDDPARYASAEVLDRNWTDNLAVLHAIPSIDHQQVAAVDGARRTWLAGRERLLEERAAAGLVRDGHGDLMADDIFCLPDGPRIIDCLEFADQYRYGDVLLDAAFLAMQLEQEQRPDLARDFLDHYVEFTGELHPASLAHHYVAYRASVRAKVAALSVRGAGGPAPAEVDDLLGICERHLAQGAVRLVLVGGLPGSGKSTLATALSDHLGLVVLRTDELRKDLVGIGHQVTAPASAYTRAVTVATYAELLERAGLLLERGESVLLDATWPTARLRDRAREVADETASRLVELQCVTDTAKAAERLRRRTGDASDAGVAVHELLRDQFDPWPSAAPVRTDALAAALETALGVEGVAQVPVRSAATSRG